MKTMPDRYAWTIDAAKAVRAGELARVDAEVLADELEQMGRSERRELKTLVQRIIEHRMKVDYIGGLDEQHWRSEVVGFQQQLGDLLEESPSLKGELTPELLKKSYRGAIERLRIGYGSEHFLQAPKDCPFDVTFFLRNPAGGAEGD